MNRRFIRATSSFSNLQSILSKMKVAKEHSFPQGISKVGTSKLFSYATDPKYKSNELKSSKLNVWDKLASHDIDNLSMRFPLNGFEEAIQMTEEGRLWKYPIDNEYGLEAEKQVPFEEHVFLEKYLEDFPKNESIRLFMSFVVSGLAKNPWMTVDRKREAIKFYKDYFESKSDIYNQAGFDIQR